METNKILLQKIVEDCGIFGEELESNIFFDPVIYGGDSLSERQEFWHDLNYLQRTGMIEYVSDISGTIKVTEFGRKMGEFYKC